MEPEIFRRAEGGLWLFQMYQARGETPDAMVELKSVGLTVPLSELYADVRLKDISIKEISKPEETTS